MAIAKKSNIFKCYSQSSPNIRTITTKFTLSSIEKTMHYNPWEDKPLVLPGWTPQCRRIPGGQVGRGG